MVPNPLAHALLHYRYEILVPLAIVEGPVLALVTGTLAARGYFSLPLLFGIFVTKDILVDGLYYGAGRFAADRLLVTRLLARVRVTSARLEHLRGLWGQHGWRAMFVAKLAFGLAPVFLIVAGLVRFPPGRFVRFAAGVAVVQYIALLGVGFALGASPDATSPVLRVLQVAGIAVAIVAIVSVRRHLRAAETTGL